MELRGGFAFGSACPNGADVVEECDMAGRLTLLENVAEAREIGVPQFGICP